MMHEYYVVATVDVNKVREEAHRNQRDDYFRKGEDCIVHYHPHQAKCDPTTRCELYRAGEDGPTIIVTAEGMNR